MHGKGRLENPDGSAYIGEFANGSQSGYGELKYCDGKVYRGGWLNNLYHGEGEFVAFVNGKKIARKGVWNKGKSILPTGNS